MRIVSIEKARRGGKFKVCFGDSEELLLSKEVIIDYGLRRNDDITNENLLKIQDSQLYHDTYFAAMRLINYRMRTKSELVQRLREKSFPREIIDRVIEKLSGLSLIDDQRFAEIFVAGKVAQKPVGRRELERKLREKGIPKDMVSKAISTVGGDEVQIGLALQAAEVKIRSLKRFDLKKRREKLVAFLARRGFDWSVIKSVIEKIFDDGFDAADL
ncbi:MAG: regulatory protein RecX [Candidatus Kryptoniota bacterium]